MNKLHERARMKIRESKLEESKKIRDNERIHAGKKPAEIATGDLP